jgi:hypothetical protein
MRAPPVIESIAGDGDPTAQFDGDEHFQQRQWHPRALRAKANLVVGLGAHAVHG